MQDLKKLTDQKIEEIIARGVEAERTLNRRFGTRICESFRSSFEGESRRDRRQLYKQIKGSGMYAEWNKFLATDKLRLQELLDDELIIETTDKRGRQVFKVTISLIRKINLDIA